MNHAILFLDIVGCVMLLSLGFYEGYRRGERIGRSTELDQVRAFILGAHRTEERLAPDDLERDLRLRKHHTWSWRR